MSLTINKADMISSMPDRGNIGHSRHYTCRPFLQWYFVTQQNCQGGVLCWPFFVSAHPRDSPTAYRLRPRDEINQAVEIIVTNFSLSP